MRTTRFSLLLLLVVWTISACQTQSRPETQPPVVRSETEAHETENTENAQADPAVQEPGLQIDILASGLDHPWDVGVLPDGTVLFTERSGTLSRIQEGNLHQIADIPEVAARGEGGLTGLAVDTDFAINGYLYLAYNTATNGYPEVRVTRYTLSENFELQDATHIVEGIPAIQSGRHSGCQLEMGQDGTLWIATGDAATGSNPQDPKSLGGKVLRVTRDGDPVEGNVGDPYDPRIFSYGHRNLQGLVLFDAPEGGIYGYSSEHGPSVEDEVNPLRSGNFGWDPNPPYDESVPMTDKEKFPDAIDALWNSGPSTIAVSGLTQLRGTQWGAWEDALAIGVLKGRQVRMLILKDGKVAEERIHFEGEFGRIRASVLGPDGDWYLTTDNGNDDKIIRITPKQ